MSFNPSKCNTINITRKRTKIHHNYSLYNQILENVPSTAYQGVELASDLTWKDHIHKICTKANNKLAFIRRNLQINNTGVKETAYKGLVRPASEYCATIWDPHHKKYIDQIEAIQRRAARFVLNNYNYKASVTDMLDRFGWESLELRILRARLAMFFRIQHNLIAVPLPPFITRPYRLKPDFPHQYRIVFASTEAYKNSFFVRTVYQWNHLPSSIATLTTLNSFKEALSSYYP